jgi:hypothetical protein
MRAFRLSIAGLLAILFLATLIVEPASAIGPLRRRLEKRRCEKQCDCAYQQAVCECHQKFPGDDPVNQISRRNCIRAAYYCCVGCKNACNSCCPPTDCCGQNMRAIDPRRLAMCMTRAEQAYEDCYSACRQHGGSAEYCDSHCTAYKDCVYQSCIIDPDLTDCAMPFPGGPGPDPTPDPIRPPVDAPK